MSSRPSVANALPDLSDATAAQMLTLNKSTEASEQAAKPGVVEILFKILSPLEPEVAIQCRYVRWVGTRPLIAPGRPFIALGESELAPRHEVAATETHTGVRSLYSAEGGNSNMIAHRTSVKCDHTIVGGQVPWEFVKD